MNHDDTIYYDYILVLSSLVGVILLLTQLYLFGMCIVYGFVDLFQSDTPSPSLYPFLYPQYRMLLLLLCIRASNKTSDPLMMMFLCRDNKCDWIT